MHLYGLSSYVLCVCVLSSLGKQHFDVHGFVMLLQVFVVVAADATVAVG